MSTSWVILLLIFWKFRLPLHAHAPTFLGNHFSWKSQSRCLHALYKKLENATTTSPISVSTFLILIYFHRLFSMANYSRANGEAQASDFVTLSSKEFYSNQRESFRLCVTAVRGTRKLNLSKFWFSSEQGMWLPTGKNFYFSKDAWGSLVKEITSLNTEIQKTGLFGMRFHFSQKFADSFLLGIVFMFFFSYLP